MFDFISVSLFFSYKIKLVDLATDEVVTGVWAYAPVYEKKIAPWAHWSNFAHY